MFIWFFKAPFYKQKKHNFLLFPKLPFSFFRPWVGVNWNVSAKYFGWSSEPKCIMKKNFFIILFILKYSSANQNTHTVLKDVSWFVMIIWFVLNNLAHFDSGITPPYLLATLARNLNGINLPPLPGDVESLICPLSPLASQEFCLLCYTRSDLLNVQNFTPTEF